MTRAMIRVTGCAIALIVAATAKASAATPDQIDAAIAKGAEFLLNNETFKTYGNWEDSQKSRDVRRGDSVSGDQWGGKTALCTYALLVSGRSGNEPQIKKAADFLRTAEIRGYYALGLRPQVWLNLPSTPQNREAVVRDFKLLWAGVEKDAGKADCGLYDYTLLDRVRIDLSVSQYGVLGMWACAQLNAEVPAGDPKKSQPNYWQMVETRWRKLQDASTGGWSYTGDPGGTPSMTAAGVATLFITQEYLHARDGITCSGNIKYSEIDKGIDFLAKALPGVLNGETNWPLYTLYGIERIGVASGLKFLGTVDWYKAGADFLVKKQASNGSWSGDSGDEVSTAFALLFLSRGREPVMVNKLRYELAKPNGEKAEGFWNQRARDVANATRYVGKQTERTLNWQILDLGVATVDDLHDAPVAYLSGGQALTLAPEQVAKLKQYVEEGGLLVFNTDCGRRQFSTSVEKLVKGMFPDREWRQKLEPSSVILSGEQFKASTWKTQPSVKAIGNGVREFALLIDDDAGKSLQTNEVTVRSDHFALMADVYQYAIDKTHASVKGRTHVVRPDDKVVTTSSVKLARIVYAGNADPEPGGWRRLAAVLRNTLKLDLQVTPVQLGKEPLDGYPIAHLTGVGTVTLTADQLAAIKKYVDGGGLLVVDAAGGDSKFTDSMTKQLTKVATAMNAEGGQLLQSSDPLYTSGGSPSPKIEYRLYRNVTGDEASKPSLHGVKNAAGRWGVIFSADDLSVGLVGNEVDGIRGYTPAAATDLMTRLVLYARDAKK